MPRATRSSIACATSSRAPVRRHDVADELGVVVGGRRHAEHGVEDGAVGTAGTQVGQADVLGALALPHVGQDRFAGDRLRAEQAEVVIHELVRDAERDAGLVEAPEHVAGCHARRDRAEAEREGHAVDGRLELGDAQRHREVGTEQLRSDVEQLARDRALEGGSRLDRQPVPNGQRRGRHEQCQERRVQREVAGEQAGGDRLPLGGRFGDARRTVARTVPGDEVRPAVPHPVAVDEVIVHAEAEVQQLLRPGDVGEQRAVAAAEAEVGRGDQSRAKVLAAIGGLGLVEEIGELGSRVGAAGAHPMPLRGGHRRRHGRVRLDLGREPGCVTVGRGDGVRDDGIGSAGADGRVIDGDGFMQLLRRR